MGFSTKGGWVIEIGCGRDERFLNFRRKEEYDNFGDCSSL